jgi:hypothetical protein
MPDSVRKALQKESIGSQHILLNPPVTCDGCWAEYLGTPGCPPAWVKRSNCLLYHRTGICVICRENFIARAFANDGYLDSRCEPIQPRIMFDNKNSGLRDRALQPTLIWGFAKNDPRDLESATDPYLRVTANSFPSYDSKSLVPFHSRKRLQSSNCLWGSGTKGCH